MMAAEERQSFWRVGIQIAMEDSQRLYQYPTKRFLLPGILAP
jgi:hypothetical protein